MKRLWHPCRRAYCNGLCAVCDTMPWMDDSVPEYSEDSGIRGENVDIDMAQFILLSTTCRLTDKVWKLIKKS